MYNHVKLKLGIRNGKHLKYFYSVLMCISRVKYLPHFMESLCCPSVHHLSHLKAFFSGTVILAVELQVAIYTN